MEKAKILVVDDENDIRMALFYYISKTIDCVVEETDDSTKALEKIKNDNYDLVLLDIKMPGLSGIDVLQQAAKFKPQTKFLIFSGYDSREIAGLALKCGAVDFISKPQTQEAIGQKIQEILTKVGKYVPRQK